MNPERTRGALLSIKEALERFPGLDEPTWRRAAGLFPVKVTRSWAERVEAIDDPLARQAFPHPDELRSDPRDVPDPVGEAGRRPVPWVVQKHADRALLLVTKRCHLNCRYCFRRDQPGPEDPTEAELDQAIAYLLGAGLEEVILSGGDPLALNDARLASILDRLRPSIPVLRIHTRAPVTAPDRVTPSLVSLLQERKPVWMVLHTNHPRELDDAVIGAVGRLRDAGIPLLNQSVLLRGVNDDPDVLVALFRRLVQVGVEPYYLHHPDAVPGGAHFGLTLADGLRIYDEVERRVSGVARPRYVIDPPDGSGKQGVREYLAKKKKLGA